MREIKRTSRTRLASAVLILKITKARSKAMLLVRRAKTLARTRGMRMTLQRTAATPKTEWCATTSKTTP